MSLGSADIGYRQTLKVKEVHPDGVELGALRIWLPRAELEADLAEGDEVRVFVHSDRNGDPLATTSMPHAEAGEFAFLEVVDLAPHGAYLDWGPPRDLFVPRFLLFEEPAIGDSLMVAIDVDDRGRLFGSNRLMEYFDPDLSELSVGQQVELWVFHRSARGWQVIVDGRHAGQLYDDQVFQPLSIGEKLTGWVHELRSDGKIDVRARRTGRLAIEDDRATLQAALAQAGGFLPLTDRSSPAEIRAQLQLSKKAFKRALGGLYKDGRVELAADGIRARVPDQENAP